LTIYSKTILAIDPGGDGSASLFKGEQLTKLCTFKYDPHWRRTIYFWCLIDKPDFCVRERVHAWSAQGISSTEAFVRTDSAADTAVYLTGVPIVLVEPTIWMNRLGLPKHSHIVERDKRRAARRKDQKTMALSLYGEFIERFIAQTKATFKTEHPTAKWAAPDVYASTLIGRAAILDSYEVPLGQTTI
jgi:hypothetical protein